MLIWLNGTESTPYTWTGTCKQRRRSTVIRNFVFIRTCMDLIKWDKRHIVQLRNVHRYTRSIIGESPDKAHHVSCLIDLASPFSLTSPYNFIISVKAYCEQNMFIFVSYSTTYVWWLSPFAFIMPSFWEEKSLFKMWVHFPFNRSPFVFFLRKCSAFHID